METASSSCFGSSSSSTYCSSASPPNSIISGADSVSGCSSGTSAETEAAAANEQTEILVAAAASLKNAYEEELIPMFQEQNPGITVTGTYDSSGKLQTQIEEGLEADVFMSAATTQMDALNEEGLIDSETMVDLLENKIVLIVPSSSELGLASFEDIAKAETIALGDPASVPAGQYAEEALTARIAGRPRLSRQPQQRTGKPSLLIDIQNNLKAQQSAGYKHWATIENLKRAAETLNFLTEHGIGSLEDLSERCDGAAAATARVKADLRATEKEMERLTLTMKHAATYRQLHPLYEEYRQSRDKGNSSGGMRGGGSSSL